jgi:hypothetical protein
MNTHADKAVENKSQAAANSLPATKSSSGSTFQFVDNRSGIAQRKVQEGVNNSARMQQLGDFQHMANNRLQFKQTAQLRTKENKLQHSGSDQIIQRVKFYGEGNEMIADIKDFKSLATELGKWGLHVTLRHSDEPQSDLRRVNDAINGSEQKFKRVGPMIMASSGPVRNASSLCTALGIDEILVAGVYNPETMVDSLRKAPAAAAGAAKDYVEKLTSGDPRTLAEAAGPSVTNAVFDHALPVGMMIEAASQAGSLKKAGTDLFAGNLHQAAEEKHLRALASQLANW